MIFVLDSNNPQTYIGMTGVPSVASGGPGPPSNIYLRPGGVDNYFRPDGTSYYIRP